MNDTTAIGGLSFKFDADMSAYMEAMKKAEKSHRAAASSLAADFEEASSKAQQSVDSFTDDITRALEQVRDVAKRIDLGAVWSGGVDAADNAVTQAFEVAKERTEDGIRDYLRSVRGPKGRIAEIFYDMFSGGIGSGMDAAMRGFATTLDADIGRLQEGGFFDKLSGFLFSAGRATVGAASAFGGLSEPGDLTGDRLRETEEKVDSFTRSIAKKFEDMAEGARRALQRIMGTLDELGEPAKKLIESFERATALSKLATDSVGKDAAERARLKFDAAEAAAFKDEEPNDVERKKLDAAKEAFAAQEKLRVSTEKIHQAEQQRQRTVESLVHGLERQALMQERNASALGKTAYQRALEQAQAIAQGTGSKAAVANDPELIAKQKEFARRMQTAANEGFNYNLAADIKQATDSYDLQTRSLGANAGEVARLKFVQMELNAMQRAGVPVTNELRETVEASGKAVGRAAQEAAEATERWNQFMSVGRTVASSLESAFGSWINGTKVSFKSLMEDMARDLARLSFRLALMPIFGGGVSGSIWESLGKAIGFGGFKAEGGPLEQGKWYIAGERGPEPVWGGGSGAFAAGYGRGSPGMGGGSTVIQMKIDLTGANGDETIARISAQAAIAAAQQAVAASHAGLPAASRQQRMLIG